MKMLFACLASLGLAAVGVAQSGACSHSGCNPGVQATVSEPQAGYSSCAVYGCYCKAFEGSGNTCSNCSHG